MITKKLPQNTLNGDLHTESGRIHGIRRYDLLMDDEDFSGQLEDELADLELAL